MMDAELKAKWIAALRSGEYEQGKYSFESRGTFCCLGVLCKAAGQPTEGMNGMLSNWRFTYKAFGADCEAETHRWTLVRMNDDEGKSFAEIADYIEANL